MQSGGLPSNSLNQLNAMQSRLLARIHRKGYKTLTETHAIGPLRLPFTRVAEPDTVLDRIVEEEDRREKITGQRREGNDLHLPYWAELWDSAFGLAEMFRNLFLRLPLGTIPQVLELGCGMGFTGMVATAMGARVLMADLEPDALLFARLNTLALENRMLVRRRELSKRPCGYRRFVPQVRTRKLNWQTDRLDEQFDLIVGADVLYDKMQWEFLDTFFRTHLRSEGKILLGEPGRQTGDLFPEWIVERGWKLGHFEQRIATRDKPIRIFRLSIND